MKNEHSIQTLITNYLWIRGYCVFRMNAGKIPVASKTGKKRLISLHPAGTPDLMAFKKRRNGMHVVFIEVKVPGNKPTQLQRRKMEELSRFGAECIVAHGLEDVQDIL